MTIKKKVCRKCKIEKKLSEFGERTFKIKSGEVKTTKSSYCRPCNIERVNEWKVKNREKFLSYQSKYKRPKKVTA